LYLRRVRRQDEIAAIERFLVSRGATCCPAAYVAPTATHLSRAEEARRLSRLQLKPRTKEEIWRELWSRSSFRR
jgi:hypothetical protein